MHYSLQTQKDAERWVHIVDYVNQLSGLSGVARLTDDEVYDLVCETLETASRRIAAQRYHEAKEKA